MKEDVKKFLVMYELPAITKYISNPYIQELIGSYVAWKINRKLKRFAYYQMLEKIY